MFEMQVLVKTGPRHDQKEWKAVRPSGGTPYQYATRDEAQRMLEMCYPGCMPDEARVEEVRSK